MQHTYYTATPLGTTISTMSKYEEARARLTALKTALKDLTDLEVEERATASALVEEIEVYIALRQMMMVRNMTCEYDSPDQIEAANGRKRPRLLFQYKKST